MVRDNSSRPVVSAASGTADPRGTVNLVDVNRVLISVLAAVVWARGVTAQTRLVPRRWPSMRRSPVSSRFGGFGG